MNHPEFGGLKRPAVHSKRFGFEVHVCRDFVWLELHSQSVCHWLAFQVAMITAHISCFERQQEEIMF